MSDSPDRSLLIAVANALQASNKEVRAALRALVDPKTVAAEKKEAEKAAKEGAKADDEDRPKLSPHLD